MINTRFITALLLCLLPAAAAFGQELRKENLKGTAGTAGSDYAVFYSYGMPESAVWPLGMKLSRDGATIRHTEAKGNGDNLPINDRVPFRFIIAPTDEGSGSGTRFWAAAMGIHGGGGGDNDNLEPDGNFNPGLTGGCKNYKTDEFPDGWRLPTQREMMLMWLFKDGINAIYSGGQFPSDGESRYWTATEYSKTEAWCFDFADNQPQSIVATKGSGSYKVRCVRDY